MLYWRGKSVSFKTEKVTHLINRRAREGITKEVLFELDPEHCIGIGQANNLLGESDGGA